MTDSEVSGPIDFLLLEFDPTKTDGSAAAALADLIDRGIIRLYDFLVIARSDNGDVTALEVSDEGVFGSFAGARSGLLGDDDIAEAGAALQPGRAAAMFVYENTWAVPFIVAARAADAEVVASARIPSRRDRRGARRARRRRLLDRTRRPAMPGLLRGVARTAVVAGTATAVSGRVQRRQAEKFAGRDAQIYADRQQAYADQAAPTYAAGGATTATSAGGERGESEMITQLKQLGELHDQGILTDDEFAAQKAKVLGS